MNKTMIKQAFDRGALTYDDYAHVQKTAADQFVFLTKDLPPPTSICEIGCGTGYLTSKLLQQYKTPYLATDISENMVNFCRKNLGEQKFPNLQVGLMDGENITLERPYDWIVSNFTFQWFNRQINAIKNLYQHSNFLIFTTLLEGTFREWKEVCHDFLIEDKVLPFLSEEEFKLGITPLNPWFLKIETEKETHIDILSFLTSLKKIGAYQTKQGPSKISKEALKKLKANQSHFTVSYKIAYCILENDQR